jgi:RIO kinase 1
MDSQTTEYLDEWDDADLIPQRRAHKTKRALHKKQSIHNVADEIATNAPAEALGADEEFHPTFTGSRYERAWLYDYLAPFYHDHIIRDVLRQVKGGKEATVYCCLADAHMKMQYIAAKVYRPKMFRALKNDAVYRQGRALLDEENQVVRGRRQKLAMKKKTNFGQTLLHNAWLANEFAFLQRLAAAGVAVAQPIAHSNNAILMEYLGDAQLPAPTLNTVRLAQNQAQALFDRVVHNIALMLAHNCVHADLSAFNILYWDGDFRIIDFPQAVSPYVNPQAFEMFARDVTRICEYFMRYDIHANPAQLARELWRQNVARDASEVFL